MKIKTFGAKHFLGQLPRIEDGFRALGHEVIDSGEADLVYANNPPFDEAIGYPAKKRIFNILDIPEHLLPEFDLEGLSKQLAHADVVTCISRSVKKQLKNYLQIDDAKVILNPIKPVSNLGFIKKEILFLYVGRANDPNKRFNLIKATMEKMKIHERFLVVVGSDNPGFGNYLGVVSDEILNQLYNLSKFVLLPSRFEGLGLPMIEALVVGTPPILTNDNPTAIEFAPDLVTEPTPSGLERRIDYVNQHYEGIVQEIRTIYSEQYALKFSPIRIAQNIIDLV
jgi:glycosyltransferase involved in cell wall biosynthesis